MFAVVVNAVVVILGGLLGTLFGRFLKEKTASAIMTALGLCTLYIGFSGALAGENVLIAIGALVSGALIGTLLNLDGAITRLGDKAQKLTRERYGQVAEGFVTASLLFCVGAMSVTGSLEAGLSGKFDTLYAKSALDFAASIMLASTLGFGVVLSAVTILVYQGAIALLAGVIAPLLSVSAVNEMTSVGSLIIIALGLNLLNVTKIKVADLLPAILVAPVLVMLVSLF